MSNVNDTPLEPSTEEQTQKIDAIVGDEVLGYDGSARGEHSGQEAEPAPPGESVPPTPRRS